jgi:glycosyltransferase involved in cell wall biosynthesis
MTDAAATSVLHLHLSDLPGEDQGQFRHRVINAVRALDVAPGFRAWSRSWHDPLARDEALAADIVVLHHLGDLGVERLIERRRHRGFVTLVEIADDPTAATPWRRTGPSTRDAFDVGRRMLHASLADGVQFSSAGLRDRYREVNPRTAVLDNLVAFPAAPPAKPGGFVIGWAGTRSHAADLAAIGPAIAAFCARHPGVVFALMGDSSLHHLLDDLPAAQRRVALFASYEEYRAFLDGLHVGLIPLEDTRFNRGRSDVKLVEMAAAGLAIVARHAPVYAAHGDVARLFSDAAELDAHLERLHADRRLLEQTATTTFDTIRRRRGDEVVRAQHQAWYASVLDARAPRTATVTVRAADTPVEPAVHPLTPHPYNIFTLEAERRRLAAQGDHAGAAALQRRLELVTPEQPRDGSRLVRYRAFGWSIASDVPLRACADASPPAVPDLRILRSHLRPAAGADARAFRVSAALTIVVESDTCWTLHARGDDPRQRYTAEVRPGLIDVGWSDVEAVDVGWNMMTAGIVAHTFVSGRPCLHGGVVTGVDGRTVAILGTSGAGKSTLAAALVASGARLVSEEVIVLDRTTPGLVQPGVPRIKTSPEAAQALGLSARARLAMRHPAYAHFGVSIDLDEPRQFQPDPAVTLDEVLLLDGRHSGTDLRFSAPLTVGAAAAALASHGYWMSHLPVPHRGMMMEASLRLARLVPTRRVTVPDAFDALLTACRTTVRAHERLTT